MSIPAELKYTQDHEWVRVEGDVAVIGITDYAQDQLSDIVFVEIVAFEGDSLDQGESSLSAGKICFWNCPGCMDEVYPSPCFPCSALNKSRFLV